MKAKGPTSPIETLQRYVKLIEEGKISLWTFVYPLHGIKLKRWVIDTFEKEVSPDIGFISPFGLTSDDMRFIASRLISKADFIDSFPHPPLHKNGNVIDG